MKKEKQRTNFGKILDFKQLKDFELELKDSFNEGRQEARKELQEEIMKEIDKRIERHEHCRDTCEDQELDELEILKQNLNKLFDKEQICKCGHSKEDHCSIDSRNILNHCCLCIDCKLFEDISSTK